MATRYRKPKLWKRSGLLPAVIGDAPVVFDHVPRRNNTAWKNARKLRKYPTPAERHLEILLNSLNNGALQGRFFTQWAFADKWILDFFFLENRLGIEVDGSVHNTAVQRARDAEKEAACRSWGITLLRVTNAQVFGPEEKLVPLLRAGWKQASKNIKSSEFARK